MLVMRCARSVVGDASSVVTVFSCGVVAVTSAPAGRLGAVAHRGTARGRLRGDGALQGGDLVALDAAPGLLGHQGGEQAEQSISAEQQGRADPAGADVERGS